MSTIRARISLLHSPKIKVAKAETAPAAAEMLNFE
jgi:hypothetical protein